MPEPEKSPIQMGDLALLAGKTKEMETLRTAVGADRMIVAACIEGHWQLVTFNTCYHDTLLVAGDLIDHAMSELPTSHDD